MTMLLEHDYTTLESPRKLKRMLDITAYSGEVYNISITDASATTEVNTAASQSREDEHHHR